MPNGAHSSAAGPPAGIDFVFDAGINKVGDQMSSVDSLDAKMGVLIGFLGALIAGILAAVLLSDPRNLLRLLSWPAAAMLGAGGALVIASLCFGFQAFRMRQYYPGLSLVDLVPWANTHEQLIKDAFLPTLLKAVELNEEQLRIKQESAKRAVWCVLFALLALVGSIGFILGGLLLTR